MAKWAVRFRDGSWSMVVMPTERDVWERFQKFDVESVRPIEAVKTVTKPGGVNNGM